MKTNIQSIHFDASEQLQAFIEKKTAKLERFFDEIDTVEVTLKVVKPETAMNKQADVKVVVKNDNLFASKICDTFEESIDQCIDAPATGLPLPYKLDVSRSFVAIFEINLEYFLWGGKPHSLVDKLR